MSLRPRVKQARGTAAMLALVLWSTGVRAPERSLASATEPAAEQMSTATADFDRDGFDDVAVAFPDDDMVEIRFGPPGGVDDPPRIQRWQPGSAGLPASVTNGDRFGAALAAADFDDDGFPELVVGAPEDDESSFVDTGSIVVLKNSPTGFVTEAARWHGHSPGLHSSGEADEHFGSTLTVGDFGKGHYPDLAIGVPGEDVDAFRDAGAVVVLYGSSSGVTAAGNQQWHGSSSGFKSRGEAGDGFASALVAGDFNGDQLDDLAIGVPEEDVAIEGEDPAPDGGAVNVLYGAETGLSATGNQQWHGSSPGLEGAAEVDDRFGAALAAGDFDKDTFEDLAIGTPGEEVADNFGAGAVVVLYGSTGVGIATAGNRQWHGDNTVAEAEPVDGFGNALSAADFDGDRDADLAIGVPREDIEAAAADAGAVVVLYGSPGVGLDTAYDEEWEDGTLGGRPETNDELGASLAAGDFNNDGFLDLAVGVPGQVAGGPTRALRILNGSVARLKYNRAPMAAFSAENCRTQTCRFVDESEDDGDLTYEWDFGDGGSSAEPDPSHFYEARGTYTVTLTVTDAFGVSDSETATVTPFNQGPSAGFTVECHPTRPECKFVVSEATNDPDGDIVTFEWTFGDGGTALSQDGRDEPHDYARAGAYEVTLTVTDDVGATDIARETAQVLETHGRRVGLFLGPRAGGYLRVSGRVRVVDGFGPCRDRVKVRIWRLLDGKWLPAYMYTRWGKPLGPFLTTRPNGRFDSYVNAFPGRWRAVAPSFDVDNDTCARAVINRIRRAG